MSETLHDLRWPAERFYWAVLDAPGLRRGGELPPGLRAAFDDEAPEPDLHVVCAPRGDGQAVACGVPRAALADVRALSLKPASVPALGAEIDPNSLNLLVGEFEPAPIRRVRARRRALILGTAMAAIALACVGLSRRAAHWRGRAVNMELASAELTHGIGGPLGAELAKARREAGVEVRPTPDAALALASVLAAWPVTVPSRPQSISIGGDTASLSVVVDGDAAPFLRALKAPKGWTLREPTLTSQGAVVRLNLTLDRAKDGAS